MKRHSLCLALVAVIVLTSVVCHAQTAEQRMEIQRSGESIVFEPYAPNILRVTLSLQHDAAVAAPGFGFVGVPQGSGWSKTKTDQADVYQSARMVATVERERPPPEPPRESQKPLAEYFIESTPAAHITFGTPGGKKFLELTGWSQRVPNHKDGTAQLLNDRRPGDPQFYTVGATFASPDDEHYYGLGGNQEGFLDHRGHPIRCWNDYRSPAAPTTCVPFLVTNKGYGLIWDNPSKTIIEAGFNEQTRWSSQVGERVSFFVIAGATADELYAGYRLWTGPTPMLPKAAYGYIQCKQRYSSQDELLSVAKGYRDRHLPADILVVDWFQTWRTGAPFMRALPLDFPNDPNVADLRDEYMFGPAFLVAPVSEQGAISRKVYLPAGSDWYNYWTNERLKGGQTISVGAPIDTIPLFVRAGSIVPMGSAVESTHQKQTIALVRVYPGADASFTLFSDDGMTYAYENRAGAITRLHWDDQERRLTHQGAAAWAWADTAMVDVAGR